MADRRSSILKPSDIPEESTKEFRRVSFNTHKVVKTFAVSDSDLDRTPKLEKMQFSSDQSTDFNCENSFFNPVTCDGSQQAAKSNETADLIQDLPAVVKEGGEKLPTDVTRSLLDQSLPAAVVEGDLTVCDDSENIIPANASISFGDVAPSSPVKNRFDFRPSAVKSPSTNRNPNVTDLSVKKFFDSRNLSPIKASSNLFNDSVNFDISFNTDLSAIQSNEIGGGDANFNEDCSNADQPMDEDTAIEQMDTAREDVTNSSQVDDLDATAVYENRDFVQNSVIAFEGELNIEDPVSQHEIDFPNSTALSFEELVEERENQMKKEQSEASFVDDVTSTSEGQETKKAEETVLDIDMKEEVDQSLLEDVMTPPNDLKSEKQHLLLEDVATPTNNMSSFDPMSGVENSQSFEFMEDIGTPISEMSLTDSILLAGYSEDADPKIIAAMLNHSRIEDEVLRERRSLNAIDPEKQPPFSVNASSPAFKVKNQPINTDLSVISERSENDTIANATLSHGEKKVVEAFVEPNVGKNNVVSTEPKEKRQIVDNVYTFSSYGCCKTKLLPKQIVIMLKLTNEIDELKAFVKELGDAVPEISTICDDLEPELVIYEARDALRIIQFLSEYTVVDNFFGSFNGDVFDKELNRLLMRIAEKANQAVLTAAKVYSAMQGQMSMVQFGDMCEQAFAADNLPVKRRNYISGVKARMDRYKDVHACYTLRMQETQMELDMRKIRFKIGQKRLFQVYDKLISLFKLA